MSLLPVMFCNIVEPMFACVSGFSDIIDILLVICFYLVILSLLSFGYPKLAYINPFKCCPRLTHPF